MGIFSRTSLAVLFLLLLAVPAHAALYAPGETLDPACAPLDADCGVASVVGTGVQGQVPYYAANGSVLSATSSITILANGNVNIAGALLSGDAEATRTNLGLTYAANGEISTNTVTIATWGDSLTQGAGGTPYPTQLTSLTGYLTYNGGVGGQNSSQIATRMLAATEKHAWPTIIWAGRVNVTATTQTKADIAAMVAALGHDNYLVIGVTNGEVTNEHMGESIYNQIVQLNDDLSDTYGEHFIDMRTYLVSLYDSNVPQDVLDHANDIPPSSLRSDGIHFNTTGYQRVAEKIEESIDILVDPDDLPKKVITTGNLGHIFANPPTIGSVTPGLGYFTALGIGSTATATNPLMVRESATRTSFTGTGTGTALLMNNAGTDSFTTLDFGNNQSGTGVPESRIGSIRTTSGSFLYFGTTNSYASGITNRAMVINPAGNIGIGTTSPSAKLHLYGSASGMTVPTMGAGSLLLENNSAVSSSIILQTITAAGPGMTVTSGARVGVGTTTPRTKLELHQIAANPSTSAINGGLIMTGSPVFAVQLAMGVSSDTTYSWIQSRHDTSTSAMYALSLNPLGGNVGIGTSSPQKTLHISSVAAPTLRIDNLDLSVNTDETLGSLEFYSNDASADGIGVGASVAAIAANPGSVYALAFSTRNGALGNVERVRIAGNGNVGIGTSTPAQALSVIGNGYLTGTLGVGTTTPSVPLEVWGSMKLGAAFAGSGLTAHNLGGLDIFSLTRQNTVATGDLSVSAFGGIGLTGGRSANSPASSGYGLYVSSGNSVGVGTTTPWRKLSVTGTVAMDGLTSAVGLGSLCLTATKEVVYNAASDNCLSSTRETKHAIKSLALSELEMLQELNPVSFVYNGDTEERKRYGFIADEADSVDSHLVTRNAEGKLSGLDTSGFLALIVGAVQELSEKVEGFADSFTTKDLNAQKLCLGSTCVTEAELQQFLNQSNQQPIAPTIPDDPEPAEPVTPQTQEEPQATPDPVPPIEEPAPSEPAL